jgi:hypothetical protein
MQAGCQQNWREESIRSQNTAEISGFILGNPALKLHAIQALNCRLFML